MLFFFDANGNQVNFVAEEVYQGSNNANKFYVIAPLASSNQVLAYFTLPNSKVVSPVYASNSDNLTLLDTLTIEDETYSVWLGALSDVVTATAGTVNVQFAFINESQTIRTQSTTFTISKGASPYEPIDLTSETTIEDILLNISNFITNSNNAFDDFKEEVQAEFNTLEEDLRTEIEGGISDYNNLSNKPIINADLTTISSPQTAYYRHTGQTTETFINGYIYLYDGTFSVVATKDYVDGQISAINQTIASLRRNAFIPVDELPTASEDTLGFIYLIPSADASADNIKLEYVTIKSDGVYFWEQIGTTAVDLSSKSAVTVNGEIVETFDADTKLDKLPPNTQGYTYCYVSLPNGEQDKVPIQTAVVNNAVVRRSGSQIKVPETPLVDNDATSKNYVDTVADTKIDKIVPANLTSAVTVKTNGETEMIPIVPGTAYANSVAKRGSSGEILAATPESAGNLCLVNKGYLAEQLETQTKYYMHKVNVSTITETFTGNVVLEILSRRPNMYTSLADMVADTDLILPKVAFADYTGDKRAILLDNAPITETTITFYLDGAGGAPITLSTTDTGFSFYDTVTAYEIPTT